MTTYFNVKYLHCFLPATHNLHKCLTFEADPLQQLEFRCFLNLHFIFPLNCQKILKNAHLVVTGLLYYNVFTDFTDIIARIYLRQTREQSEYLIEKTNFLSKQVKILKTILHRCALLTTTADTSIVCMCLCMWTMFREEYLTGNKKDLLLSVGMVSFRENYRENPAYISCVSASNWPWTVNLLGLWTFTACMAS